MRGAGVELPPARAGLADVLVWGVIDWHFRIQRPQHLARELARAGHRVLYVSPRLEARAEPGFAVQRLDPELALFHVELATPHAPSIYHGVVTDVDGDALASAVRGVLHWLRPARTWSLVEHPGWGRLPELPPGARVVYDWMDDHQGFANSARELVAAERELVARADLVVVSSEALRRQAEGRARSLRLLRNAAEFEPFHAARVRAEAGERPVLGYYGALAEWFDVELVRALARRFPAAEVRLVGADTAGVAEALADEANVSFAGEVPYAALPRELARFDVCLIPFLVNELTRATNPVKVYEYLASGKPVVTTDLPEIRDAGLDALVERCRDRAAFLEAVAAGLAEAADDPRRAARSERARTETWGARGAELRAALTALPEPLVSVVVVTWNNLALTQACLASLFADPERPPLEVLVVDNGSTDGTPAWLAEQAAREPRLTLILNEDNRGFAAANNQGLERATGEYVVLLNNDTVVTRGWLRALTAHFRRDPDLGLLGPITNNIGNEARVPTSYVDAAGMHAEAALLVLDGAGRSFALDVAAFFCVMGRRETFEEVGPLDEGFGMGFFEDDDYCRRVRELGKTIRCAEDAFVHHELSASFDKVDPEARRALFERNKRYYESKWGEWIPHAYRPAQAAREERAVAAHR
ncbi:MAG: glycosyltransferase [Planctomycetes bacterium]|nr:glycosyltransferase [Planctomycetota bacterium]